MGRIMSETIKKVGYREQRKKRNKAVVEAMTNIELKEVEGLILDEKNKRVMKQERVME